MVKMTSMQRILLAEDWPRLLAGIEAEGYQLVGPTLRDDAIVMQELSATDELPRGLVDVQAPGKYRLSGGGSRLFDYGPGPGSFKRFLHPPEVSLFRVRKRADGLVFESSSGPERPYALVGARSCDLAAIAIQDRVLLDQDEVYRRNRQDMFVLAVQCSRAGDLCFCTSTDSGPKAESGFDLALTELPQGMLLEVGSEVGRRVLARVPTRAATETDLEDAGRVWRATAQSMPRRFDAEKVRRRLAEVPEHPRWKEVADRCLTCGNCTQVCPTCFCSSTVDSSSLDGQQAERTRLWDSCFSLELSHIHGLNVRQSPRSRYRQWLTHKLSTWFEQFGTSGCVGCGRCVAWCPVGIDILEEAEALCEPSI